MASERYPELEEDTKLLTWVKWEMLPLKGGSCRKREGEKVDNRIFFSVVYYYGLDICLLN